MAMPLARVRRIRVTRKRDRRDRSFSLGQAALRFLWGTEVDVPAKRSQLESLLWHREVYSRNGPVEGIAWLLSTKAQAVRMKPVHRGDTYGTVRDVGGEQRGEHHGKGCGQECTESPIHLNPRRKKASSKLRCKVGAWREGDSSPAKATKSHS